MLFTEARVEGAWVIDPSPYHDERGRFMRAWCVREFEYHGVHFLPVQANMQFSPCKGTVRGLHLQAAPALEAKLVRCTRGAIFDVAVDCRPASPTFGEWCSAELTAENRRMLYVPEHCAHGYQCIEDNTEVMHLTSAFYAPQSCRGARFDDPAFGVQLPLPVSMISEQDRNWPLAQDQGYTLGQSIFYERDIPMNVDTALLQRESCGDPIRVGMVGPPAGPLPCNLGTPVPGMRLMAIANRTPEHGERAFGEAGAGVNRSVWVVFFAGEGLCPTSLLS